VTVRVHRASEAARRAVEAAGGRVELLEERVTPAQPVVAVVVEGGAVEAEPEE
jgi:hypothetical protein